MAIRGLTSVMAVLLVAAAAAAPQQEPATNPRAGNADAISEGRTLFRSECSYCHGIDARGGSRGPDLTAGRFLQGDTDATLFATITDGTLSS